ncbi:MAG: PadR family transcriptional regulator [Anaerolineae bacterium]|jgi:PadR family transcriptional regulator PadR
MHEHRHGHGRRGRLRPEGRVRRFLQPWLLLLLVEKPSHGYELMERLAQDPNAPEGDPGVLYPLLRRMEAEGLVRSAWDTESKGPARRLYEVTPEGVEYLHAWAVSIRTTRDRLDAFLNAYASHFEEEERRDADASLD